MDTQRAHPENILIVTTTKVEAQAVLQVFSQAAGIQWERKMMRQKIYYDLGCHGGAPVFMVQSETGSATPGGSLLTVSQAIQDLGPQAVIMCGLVYGLRPDRQKIGDILIAKQLEYYEPQKVNAQGRQIPRGDRVAASERLLDRFRSADLDWTETLTHFGLVLSGEKSVNDPAFRDQLLEIEPEAIGGDLDGAGLYAAARDEKKDWILVKAIAYWADDSNSTDIASHAAQIVARFVLQVLQLGGWGSDEQESRSQLRAEKAGRVFPQYTYTFENRVEDIQRISNRLEDEPYLHLYGPSGIGKSHLSKQLLETHYSAHPQAYIDLAEIRGHTLNADTLLFQTHWRLYQDAAIKDFSVQDVIVDWALKIKKGNAPYTVVVFDNFDCLPEGARRDWREKILPVLEEKIADPTRYIRFVTAAQFELEELRGRGRISFQPYQLRVFDGATQDLRTYKRLLLQAVKKWGRRQFSANSQKDDDVLRRWANELYTLTGGHPGAIVGILNLLGHETGFAHEDVFVEKNTLISREVLQPLLDQQMQRQSVGQYRAAFARLFIFRYLSKGIFRQLINTIRDNPNWQGFNAAMREADYTEYVPIWERFTETALLNRYGKRLLTHQLSPVWRRMGNLLVQLEDSCLYCALHRDARLVFDHFVNEQVSDASLRMDCFVEGLYHLCQETTYPAETFTQDVLQRTKDFVLLLRKDPRGEDYLYIMETLLENDLELQEAIEQRCNPGVWHELICLIRDNRH